MSSWQRALNYITRNKKYVTSDILFHVKLQRTNQQPCNVQLEWLTENLTSYKTIWPFQLIMNVNMGGPWTSEAFGRQWSSGSCRLSTNRKVGGSIPGSTGPSVEVSLSKTPNPSCSRRAGWRLAWLTPPSVYEWMNEWVYGWMWGKIVKRFGWPLVYESAI